MPTFQSPVDSATLFYRYYVPSTSSPHKPAPDTPHRQPLTLVLLHGWPMSSRMFDSLIVPLVETYRFPAIAPDRRGFGNSRDWSNPSTPGEVTFDTFVADLSHLLNSIKIGPFVFVAASMGAPESLLAYQHGLDPETRMNCRGFVWVGPNMPYSIRCEESPDGPDPAIWDFLVDGFRSNRGKEFIHEQIPSVFRGDLNPDRIGDKTLQFFERIVGKADPIALERCAIICQKPMERELRTWVQAECRKEGVQRLPVLIIHGDADTGMPLEGSSEVVKEIIPWSELKVYEGAGHGEFLCPEALFRSDIPPTRQPSACCVQLCDC